MTTPPAQAPFGLRGLLARGGVIAVAIMVMNVATYGYTILVAHTVGTDAFGAFSALMGVLLVVNVLSLGLQATGARRVAAHPDHVAEIERMVLGVGVRSAAVLGVLCLLLAPVLNVVLHLESLPTAMLVAAAAVPLTIMGSQAGVLQGERRWDPLALVYLAQGVGRVACGTVLILIWPTEFSAMLGVAVGAWLPVVVGYVALRRPRDYTPPPAEGHPGLDLLREVGHSSQALFAFFALSNADILMARAVLPEDQAGLYAGGLILAKALLFLPQFVVVVAFPSMSKPGASRRTLALALVLVGLLGVAGLAGILLFPDLALKFVGGSDFAAISDDLWIFAIIGTVLSMIQLLVYSALARRQARAIVMIWTTLVVLLVGATQVASATSLAILVACIDSVLFVALLALALTMKPGNARDDVAPSDPNLLERDI